MMVVILGTVLVSQIQRISCQSRELLETVANPYRGLLNAGYGDTTVVLEYTVRRRTEAALAWQGFLFAATHLSMQ